MQYLYTYNDDHRWGNLPCIFHWTYNTDALSMNSMLQLVDHLSNLSEASDLQRSTNMGIM